MSEPESTPGKADKCSDNPESYVRARWQYVSPWPVQNINSDGLYLELGCSREHIIARIESKEGDIMRRLPAYLAAYAFTLEHERKIAERRGRIWRIELAKQVMERRGYEWGDLGDAILNDEKRKLAELLRGFKEQSK